jgi:hypothetical protein
MREAGIDRAVFFLAQLSGRCLCLGFRGRNQSTACPSQTRCVHRRLLQRDFVEAPKHVPECVYMLPRPVLDLMARQINVRKIHHDGLAAVAVLAVEPRHTDLETMPARAEYTHTHGQQSKCQSCPRSGAHEHTQVRTAPWRDRRTVEGLGGETSRCG